MMSRAIVITLLSAVSVGALAAEDVGSVAQVTVASGPQAGKYDFASDDACVIAPARPGTPPGFSVTLIAATTSLAIDVPSTDAKQLGAFQVELVVAAPKGGQSRRNTASSVLVVDTRPDSALAKYQRDERGPNGMQGNGSLKLQQQAQTARLEFEGQTAQGTKLQGWVECRKVDREPGR